MKHLRTVVTIILLISVLFCLSGCKGSDKKEIETLLGDFQTACNALDFDSVLECVEPKVADTVNMATGVIGLFTETEPSQMFDALSETMRMGDLGGKEFFESVKIEVEDVKKDGETATASTILTYKIGDNETVREADFVCTYYAEKWYISDLVIN